MIGCLQQLLLRLLRLPLLILPCPGCRPGRHLPSSCQVAALTCSVQNQLDL
jgi:hypothetical protein